MSRSFRSVAILFVGLGIVGLAAVLRPSATPRLTSAISGQITPAYPSTNLFSVPPSIVSPPDVFTAPITGAIVNHHLLAASFIDDTLRRAWRPGVKRIILLAPNHFSAGRGTMISTTRSFATPFGEVPVDADAVQRLAQRGIISLDDEPFELEHGVFNVLPFIRRVFPDVPIVPIITKVSASPGMIDAVRQQLELEISRTTLVIASLDFAHGQTLDGADRLDEQSLKVLSSLDLETGQLNHDGLTGVDSPFTLRLFLGLMERNGASQVAMVHHSNSARETGQLTATDVTSHITALFSRFPIVLQ